MGVEIFEAIANVLDYGPLVETGLEVNELTVSVGSVYNTREVILDPGVDDEGFTGYLEVDNWVEVLMAKSDPLREVFPNNLQVLVQKCFIVSLPSSNAAKTLDCDRLGGSIVKSELRLSDVGKFAVVYYVGSRDNVARERSPGDFAMFAG